MESAALQFQKARKVSSELLGLTYGALVLQLLNDYEGDVELVNKKLDEMGMNMGRRLVDEVLSKAAIRRCGNFRDTASTVANVGFKMYWNVTPKVTNWNDEGTVCFLIFPSETPLEEFVQIPEKYKGLRYSQVLCGVIKGALETLSMRVECSIMKDRLIGDDVTEIRLELLEIQKEMAGEDYREN